ncbi:copper chaperone PCu(A)C [Bordetella sp. FB-8]|uniref:copper chaperone PCu(A)C n=1 Tax=Bordetella sp. FB-8 TaxID=1159870 RepID=UPI0003A0C61D|nr:copper chaperone PCu(A)C [Bordetella sp. FB-8]
MKQAIMLAGLLALPAAAAYAQGGGMPGMSPSATMHDMAPSQASAAPENVSIQGCWIRLLPGGAPSAGYFTVENSGNEPVSLVGVHTDAFGMAMLHQTRKDSKGMMGMSPVSDVPVPPKGRLAFAPGGYHVMLEKPTRPLHAGDKVALTLRLGGNRMLRTQCEARSPASAAK